MVSVHALLLLVSFLFEIAKAQLPQPGVYHKISARSCNANTLITTKSDCKAAAKAVLNYTSELQVDDPPVTDYPQGCYISGGTLWWNNHSDTTKSGPRDQAVCSINNKCFCKGDPSQTFPGSTTSHVATGGHKNCEAAGRHTITTKYHCHKAANNAAASLNLGKTFAITDVTSEFVANKPAGCYITPTDNKLMLNTYSGTDAPSCQPGATHRGCLCVNTMVHGGWSAPKNTACDYPCDAQGYGTQYMVQMCDNPMPSGGGLSCTSGHGTFMCSNGSAVAVCKSANGGGYSANQIKGPPSAVSSKCPTKGLPAVMQASIYKANATTFMHTADPQRQTCPVPQHIVHGMHSTNTETFAQYSFIYGESSLLCDHPAWTVEECKSMTGQTPIVEHMYQCNYAQPPGKAGTCPPPGKIIIARPPGCYRNSDDGKVYFNYGLFDHWKRGKDFNTSLYMELFPNDAVNQLVQEMKKKHGGFSYDDKFISSGPMNTKLPWNGYSSPAYSVGTCSKRWPCYCNWRSPYTNNSIWSPWVIDTCIKCPINGAGISKYKRTCLLSNKEMCVGPATKTNDTACNDKCPEWKRNAISSCEANGVYGEREYERSCAPSQCVGGSHKHVREEIPECKLVKTNVQCGGINSTHATVTQKANCGSACEAEANTTSVATQASPECRWERNVTKNPCTQCHRHQGKLRGSIFEYRSCQGASGVTVTCNGGNTRRFSTSCTTCGAISADYPQSTTCSTCLHSGTGFEPYDTNRTSEIRCMNCAQPCPLNVFESFTNKPYYDLANPVYNTATCGDFTNQVHGVEIAKGLIDSWTHAGVQNDAGGYTVSNGDFSHLSAGTSCKASCQGGSNIMVTGHIKCVNTTLLHNASGTFTPFNVTNKATWPRCDIPASKMTASQMETIYVAKFGSSKCA